MATYHFRFTIFVQKSYTRVDEMGVECGSYGEEKCIHTFVEETRREETAWQNKPQTRGQYQNVHYKYTIRLCGMDSSGSGCGIVEALVNMVMNIRVSM